MKDQTSQKLPTVTTVNTESVKEASLLGVLPRLPEIYRRWLAVWWFSGEKETIG